MTYTLKSVKLSNGLTIPYAVQGAGGAVPMVLLHGFAGSWRDFEHVLPYLPPAIHALVPTLRGHGDASKPAAGYRLADFAADVAAFLDAVDVDAAVIAGHSLGSAIAQRVAIDYPQETLGLVLISACVVRPGDAKAQAFWDNSVSRLSDPVDPAFVRDFLHSTTSPRMTPAEREVMERESRKVPAHVWQGAWRARLEEDFSGELHHIAAPTLIVWGDRDERCPRREQEELLAGIQHAELLVYEGAGHGLLYEEPKRLAADIETFVERHLSEL